MCFSTGYSSAGFLAYLTEPVIGSSITNIPFDTEAYDEGDNYDPATGIFTVPYSGLYLVLVRVYSTSYEAHHWIRVDGGGVAYTEHWDPYYAYQHASTSLVLDLIEGQTLSVDPAISGEIYGDYLIRTSFSAILLYPH